MGSIKHKAERLRRKAFLCMAFCFGLCAFSFHRAKAQTFAEWFEQGKTQIKYLVLQIEALNAFQNSVRQGYNELHNDWWAIKDWKNGEYALHTGYYNSLNLVNPVVAQYADKSGIQTEQQSIISQFVALSGLDGLTPDEQIYIGTVQRTVLSDCSKTMTDLQNALTAGKLAMSDDERIKRIAKDDDEIKDQYEFTCHFCNQVRLLAAQRNAEQNEFLNLNPLYENH
ncbi:MAG TPA: hypothetical protein VIM89_11765 [Mucilaginibacter sp.]